LNKTKASLRIWFHCTKKKKLILNLWNWFNCIILNRTRLRYFKKVYPFSNRFLLKIWLGIILIYLFLIGFEWAIYAHYNKKKLILCPINNWFQVSIIESIWYFHWTLLLFAHFFSLF
jgi:hypothetical protein